MKFENKRLIGIVVVVALLLMVPLLAMRLTDEVNWGPVDFTVAAVLLLGTGLLCELFLRIFRRTAVRLALCATALIALFLVWAELAVGLVGMRFAGS